MSRFHEMYGLRVEELEEVSLGFQQTLQLLRDLVDGRVKLEELEIGLTGWSIKQEEEE